MSFFMSLMSSSIVVPVPELEKHGHHIWKYIRLSIDHLACTFDEPFYSTWNLDFMEFNQSLQI